MLILKTTHMFNDNFNDIENYNTYRRKISKNKITLIKNKYKIKYNKNGDIFLYMIGVGWIEEGKWKYKKFYG